MMFRPGDIVRYQDILDIDLYIVKAVFKSKLYTKYKVCYLNNKAMLDKNILIDPRPQIVRIRNSDINKWRLVTDEYSGRIQGL